VQFLADCRAKSASQPFYHGLLEGKSLQEAFSDISRITTLSHAYLDKLNSIYTSPMYQDSIESHPLREKKLKKEIIDACVAEWRRMNRSKPSERSIIADITACYQGCRRIDYAGPSGGHIALSVHSRK
jgi:hypothetical protein